MDFGKYKGNHLISVIGMAFLTNISALNSFGDPIKSLLFPYQCILCNVGDPNTPDSFTPFDILGYSIQPDRIDCKRTG